MALTPMSGRSWWATVAVASIAAFLVAAFVSSGLTAAEVNPDFLFGYHPGALGIQIGAGYVSQTGELITHWPPGMSTFISPWIVDDVWDSIQILRFVSGVLAAAWTLLVALLFRLLLPRVSIIAGLGLAVFWPAMWAIGNPMASEMLFTVLSTIAIYALARLYRLRSPSVFITLVLTIATGLSLAAAALTRTIGIAAAAAVFVGIAVGFRSWPIRRRIAVLLLSAAVFAIGLAPWVLTYEKHTGNYGFTSNGFNSVRDGLNRYPNFSLGLELKKRSEGWQSFEDIRADLREVSAADRMGALRLLGIKIVHPWYATWSRRVDRFLLVFQLPWLLLFSWASVRALRRWRWVPGEIILLHGFVAALWLVAALVLPLLRYLTPAFPFVVIVVLWHAVDANILGSGAEEPKEMAA